MAPGTLDTDRQHSEAVEAARRVRRSITRMARQLRVQRSDHGVSPSKISVLARLHRARGPMIATDLARLERLQPQSLTRLIADLDERGLIRRRPAEADRRQLLIEITPAGRKLLGSDARQQDAWLAQAMAAKLTVAERELLGLAAGLLDRLADEEADTSSHELPGADVPPGKV